MKSETILLLMLALTTAISANIPTDGLIIHLRADALTNLNDGDPLTLWPDSATTDTADGTVAPDPGFGAPVYKTNAVNGHPALCFVRSEQDVLLSSNWTLPNPAEGLTIFTVCTGGDSGGVERLMQIGAAAGAVSRLMAVDVSSGRSGCRYNNGYSLTHSDHNPLTPGQFHIAVRRMPQNGTHDSLYYAVNSRDPLPLQANNPANTITFNAVGNHISVGTGRNPSAAWYPDFYNGDLAEILIYNRQLSDIEIHHVGKYLSDKYNLPFDSTIVPLLQNPFYVTDGPDAGHKVTVYDGAMEKYNGFYYLFGTGSGGEVYASPDLIHWLSPVEWMSRNPAEFPSWVGSIFYLINGYGSDVYDRYGAGDIFFHNGVMFWCFNTMAIAGGNPLTLNDPDPEFYHFSEDHPYSRGIDGQFFVSHEGDLLYIRKVNPNEPQRGDGTGEVWIFELGDSFFNDPFHEERSDANFGYEVLTGQKGRWDNLDFFNFEGPELYYRNGQYYMLYVGNKMQSESGLYDTGVAQDTHWTQLDNADKYPGKLLARNFERLLLRYDALLPTCEHGGHDYRYTFTRPAAGWQQPGFDDSAWPLGEGGFGYPTLLDNGPVRVRGLTNAGQTNSENIWSSPDGPQQIWLRREFQLASLSDNLILRHRLAGNGAITVNGHTLIGTSGYSQSYRMHAIPAEFLRSGTNIIAAEVTAQQNLQQNHIDFGVYDTNNYPLVHDVVGPSQPHIARGPNGFENWIAYKAFWNGLNGQGKNRLYFWDDEMITDGPTADLPVDAAEPVFHDDFASAASLDRYDPADPEILYDQQALFFDSDGDNAYNQTFVAGLTAANLFIEANIRFAADPGAIGRAGVIPWHLDSDNWVRVYIERTANRLFVPWSFNGVRGDVSFNLPATFSYTEDDPRAAGFGEQYHTLKVYKNGARFYAELDHYKVNNGAPLLDRAETAVPARLGLAAFRSRHWLDNLTISLGWEEDDNAINAWNAPWPVTADGITSPPSGRHFAVKGDPTIAREFSACLDTGNLPADGAAGLAVPCFDENNALIVAVNYAARQLELRRLHHGSEQLLAARPLTRDTIYGYSNFEGVGQTEYHYDLRGQVAVSRARALWLYGNYDYLNRFYLLPDHTLDSFGLDAWQDDAWQPVPVSYIRTGRGRYEEIPFNTETITARLRLRVPAEINRPFAFAVREEAASQNFLRVLRREGRLYVWLNNELFFDVHDPFAGLPARVALYTNDCSATFDAITCFNIAAPTPLGDLNRDYRVDLPDLHLLTEKWLAAAPEDNYTPYYDLSRPADGIINLHDITTLSTQWLLGNLP